MSLNGVGLGSSEDDLDTRYRTIARTLAEVRTFLDGSHPVDFRLVDRNDAYGFVRRTLVRFRYATLDKPSKGLLRRFLGKVTGLSRAQLTRLIGQYRATGRIEDRRRGPAQPFERRYTAAGNDNALAESKNGTVIRHYLGRAHIPGHHAARVNDFTGNVLSPFLKYHQPCHFPSRPSARTDG